MDLYKIFLAKPLKAIFENLSDGVILLLLVMKFKSELK